MDNRKFKTIVFVTSLMVALSTVLAKGAEKMQYKLKFEKGQKYYTKTITEQKISQTVMGQEQNMEQTIGMGIDFDVNDVDANGNAWIDYTYSWAMSRQKGPMGEIVYDSSDKDSPVPPQVLGFAALLGQGFSLQITHDGQVKQIKGLDKMSRNIQKELPEGPLREQMTKGLDQFLSEEAIKEQTEISMAIYPDKPVGVGDSWSKTSSTSHGFAIIMENKWTLKSCENGMATIEVLSNIKSNPDAKPMEMGPAKMSYEFTGNQKGLIKMQESTGQILHSKTEQQMSGQMKMIATGPQPQEMMIPMKINGIITTETTEKKYTKSKQACKTTCKLL